MDSIELVKEFHEVFGHTIGDKPQLPSTKDTSFRYNFMKEELEETIAADTTDDIVAFADGLADIQYVLDGWFLNAGLHDKKEAIMAEVHRSNMTKACKTVDETVKTIIKLKSSGRASALLEYHHEPRLVNGEWVFIVYRTHDRKVMKSINYEPPNLEPIINS